MKKIILSAAVAAMAFSTSALAADKGIDIDVSGQAVVYYQTADVDGQNGSLFDEDHSSANVGIQLNLGADLGNNFTFGSQFTYLGTAGLEKNLVRGVRQVADDTVTQGGDTNNELALTKIFIAKKIANTTVKIGRQELPKSLSPLAYTEGWNVFKNTFDAILVVNTDIPNTTLVGAYVAGGTGMDLGNAGNLGVVTPIGTAEVEGTAYMITAQTKAIPMTTLTASYYHLSHVAGGVTLNNAGAAAVDSALGNPAGTTAAGTVVDATPMTADAFWLDIAIADKDLPVTIGLQAGQIKPDSKLKDTAIGDIDFDDTTALGAKVGMKIDALKLCLAYTDVDGDDDKVNVAVKNTGTNTKSPVYTQMIANQNAISLDAKTVMLKASYNTGDFGTFGIAYSDTTAGDANLNGADNDYNELDVTYKIKAGGVQYFAGYVRGDFKSDDSDFDLVRLWARYNF